MSEKKQTTGLGKLGGTIGLVAGVVLAYALGWGLIGAIIAGLVGSILVGSLLEVLSKEFGGKSTNPDDDLDDVMDSAGSGAQEDDSIEIIVNGESVLTVPAMEGLSLEEIYEILISEKQFDAILGGEDITSKEFGPGSVITITTT